MQTDTAAHARKRHVRWRDWLMAALFLALVGAYVALALLRLRADTSVTVQLPDQPITIGGRVYDSADAAHPLLMQQGIVYFPVSEAKRLGLRSEQTDDGLTLSITGAPDATAEPARAETPNLTMDGAVPLTGPITIMGEAFDNANADTPFLNYRGAAYLPLTEALCTALCLDYTQTEDGISVAANGRLRAPTDALPHFILHMAGTTDSGEINTNSIEAANHSYEEGYRWLEIDFNWTRDDALVCVHDWGNWKKRLGVTVKTPPTLKRFERLDAKYADTHSFTPALLALWLKEHPDAMIVTDVKEDNIRAMTWLSENYPELRDRLVVQIYALDEYDMIRSLGYDNIILTMYRIPWEEYHDIKTLCAFIRDTRILAITMAADENVRDVFAALVETGIPIYVHTIDDPAEQTQWFADGAYGIYTNYGDMRAE